MNLDSLRDFISQGIEDGASISELRHKALEMGVSTQEFDQAYDLIVLGAPLEGSVENAGEVVEEIQAQEVTAESEPEPTPVIAPVAMPQPKEQVIPVEPIVMPREDVVKPAVVAPKAPKPEPVKAAAFEEKAPSVSAIEPAAPKKRGGFFNWFKVHKLAVAVLVLVCVLSGVGYVGATMLMAPNINEIRGLIFQKMQEMDTVVYQGSIEGEVTTEASVSLESIFKDQPTETLAKITSGRVAGSQNTKVRLDFNGATDIRDIDSPKSEFSFTLTASGFVVGMETKTIDDELFLKLTQIPDFGLQEINDLLNQWLRIDYAQIQEEIGAAPADRDEGLTLEQKQRVLRILSTSSVFKIAERIGTEEIDGKSTYHYRYTIDEDGLIAMLEELAEVFGSETKFTLEDREAFKEWFDSAGGEIWIAKRDYAPVKLTFDLMMKSVNDAPVSGRLSFELKFNKYNEPVAIEAPYPFKDLTEVLKEYTSAAPTSITSENSALLTPEEKAVLVRDEKRLQDVRDLMVALELFYNDNGGYPAATNGMIAATAQATSRGTAWSTYMDSWPQAPTPADGSCTETQNKYTYAPKQTIRNGVYPDYVLSFCFGGKVSGYESGPRTTSAFGIQ